MNESKIGQVLNQSYKTDTTNLERIIDSHKDKSGFFDLPLKAICYNPEHQPPMHLFIPQGKGYRHVCPECGKVTNIFPPQISF